MGRIQISLTVTAALIATLPLSAALTLTAVLTARGALKVVEQGRQEEKDHTVYPVLHLEPTGV